MLELCRWKTIIHNLNLFFINFQNEVSKLLQLVLLNFDWWLFLKYYLSISLFTCFQNFVAKSFRHNLLFTLDFKFQLVDTPRILFFLPFRFHVNVSLNFWPSISMSRRIGTNTSCWFPFSWMLEGSVSSKL